MDEWIPGCEGRVRSPWTRNKVLLIDSLSHQLSGICKENEEEETNRKKKR